MSEKMNRLSSIISVPAADGEDARRRKLLNVLLLGVAVGALIALAALLAAAPLGLAGEREEVARLRAGIAVTLVATAAIFALNRYVSGRLASTVFLLLLTAILTFSDEPPEVVEGRSLFLFAIPILAASVLLRPWASFAFAGLSSLVVAAVGIVAIPHYVPNVPVMLGFILLALVSWLSARSLERAVHDLQTLNRELDRRVEQRTRDLREA